MFLGFNSLVETVRISSSRHYTSCKFIYNQYLVIFYNIVLIPEHKVMCPEGKYYIMLYVKIICICKIIYVEELLNLGNTFFSQPGFRSGRCTPTKKTIPESEKP